ncbi:MAG: hypothetical protein ABI743_13820, partial [bacterium]
MLTRLYVKNYKTLMEFKCSLGARQLLLGGNGSGKSAVVEILELVRDFCVRGVPLDGRVQEETRTHWVIDPEQEIELEVILPSGRLVIYKLVLHTRGEPARPAVAFEELRHKDEPLVRVQYGELELQSFDHP